MGEAVKQKGIGNKAFQEKRHEDALKAWKEAKEIWKKADVDGHHMAVLLNNEALCRRNMGDLEGCRKAAEEGLKHFTTDAIRAKLEHNIAESEKPIPEPTEEEKAKEVEKLQ